MSTDDMVEEDHTTKQDAQLQGWWSGRRGRNDKRRNKRNKKNKLYCVLRKRKTKPEWVLEGDSMFVQAGDPYHEHLSDRIKAEFGTFERFYSKMRDALNTLTLLEVYNWLNTNKETLLRWVMFNFGRQSKSHIRRQAQLFATKAITDGSTVWDPFTLGLMKFEPNLISDHHLVTQQREMMRTVVEARKDISKPLASQFQVIHDPQGRILLGDSPFDAFYNEGGTYINDLIYIPLTPYFSVRILTGCIPNDAMKKVIEITDDMKYLLDDLNANTVKTSLIWTIGREECHFDSVIKFTNVKSPLEQQWS